MDGATGLQLAFDKCRIDGRRRWYQFSPKQVGGGSSQNFHRAHAEHMLGEPTQTSSASPRSTSLGLSGHPLYWGEYCLPKFMSTLNLKK